MNSLKDAQAPIYTYCDLLIIDEMLPCAFSPFRTLEYAHYLSFFDSSILMSTEGWHAWASNLSFDQHLEKSDFSLKIKSKIKRISELQQTVPALAYITFLHNAFQAFPMLEKRGIPFILQLYPGGSFELNNEHSDEKLRILSASPLCRKIITTQLISKRYLIEKIGCDPQKIEFIYGGVYNTRHHFDFSRDKKLFGQHKDSIDICFVAHRYGDDVKKKGYDQFVAVAQAFADSHPHVRFHVVGDYTPDQLPLGSAAKSITFHGSQPNTFFKNFYPQMDMILSVNRPAAGLEGAFDGFPTGACMEAGFHGVLNLISDPLALNVAFTDDEDVVLLDEDTERTIARIAKLTADPERLYRMSYANWKKFHEIFDTDRQLWARTQVITTQLLAREKLIIRPTATTDLDAARFIHLLALNAGLMAGKEDIERRHDSLLHEYHKLAEGVEELRGVVAAKEAALVELMTVPLPPPTLGRRFRNRASRIKQKLLRTFGQSK